MSAPPSALARLARLPDPELSRCADPGSKDSPSIQFVLYDLLRKEQALAAGAQPAGRTELARILDLAQTAFGELCGVLIGRSDALLERARDGEWSLRDVLRHAIAVELRYGAQVEYAARRGDDDPLAIPNELLPCDRLSPPDPQFSETRTGGFEQILELLGLARAMTDTRLAGIPDAALSRPSLWGTQPMTVRLRLHQIAVHLTECVIQSEKCLRAEAPSDARPILRRLCAARGAHERWSSPTARAALDERYRLLAAAR